MRQIGQDHRPPGQGRGLADDLIQRRAGHGQFGEHLVQPLGGTELGFAVAGIAGLSISAFVWLRSRAVPLVEEQPA